jgi:transposase
MTPRIAVVTGVERRRRFTKQQKRAFLAEAAVPGSSVSDVARKHGLARALLQKWKKQLEAGPDQVDRGLADTEKAASAFARAALVETRALSLPSGPSIRMTLPGGIALDFPGGMDPAALALFVRAVGR